MSGLEKTPARCRRHPAGRAGLAAGCLLFAAFLAPLPGGEVCAQDKPLALALGIGAGQGGEYVDAARYVADAVSAELAKADEFEILFFDAENPTIKRALVEGRLESDMLSGVGTPEGLRELLSQLGARFGIDITLDAITEDPESVRVDLSIRVVDLADPGERRFSAAGVKTAEGLYADSLKEAAASAGEEAGRTIRREIVSMIESAGGAGGGERQRELEESARAKLESGDPQGALEDLDAACHLAPKEPRLRALKAQAHDASGQLDRAVVEARRAVYLDDSDPEFRLVLGRLYLKSNEASRAVGELKEAIRLGLDTHDVRMALGEAYMSQGLTVQAEEHFEMAAELAPKDLEATLRLGQVYERSRTSEAEAVYRAYLEQAESPEVRIRLAAVLAKRKDYEGALANLSLAADQSGSDFSTAVSYAPCAAVIDHQVMAVANELRAAVFEYGDEKITREELYTRLKLLLGRSEEIRDLGDKVEPPAEDRIAHGHRRFASELLVQAAINLRTYVETDKAYMRDQYDLLHNEAIREIAAAQRAGQ